MKISAHLWIGDIRSRRHLMAVAGMDGRKVSLSPTFKMVVVNNAQGNICRGLAYWLNHGSSEEDVKICSGGGQLGMCLWVSSAATMYRRVTGLTISGRKGRDSKREEIINVWRSCCSMGESDFLVTFFLWDKLRKCVGSVSNGCSPEHLLSRSFLGFMREKL